MARMDDLAKALSRLSDSARQATYALGLLSAAIEKLDPSMPVVRDAACCRMLSRLLCRCDMPITKYFRRY
jgi:hypothetical protein